MTYTGLHVPGNTTPANTPLPPKASRGRDPTAECKGTFHLPELASKTGHFADGVPQFEFWVACQFFEFLQNGAYISLIMQFRRIFRSRP